MFKNKKNKIVKNEEKKDDIEIIIGDDSALNISDVGDCMNDLRPKHSDKKAVVIPKERKKDKEKK